jgi:hypothetical protein
MNLPIDKLEPGMEVAADVVNLNGVLLIGEGAILTERHLRILKTWGIDSVSVAGQESAEAAPPPRELEFSPEIIERAEAHVNHRFRHASPDISAVKVLRELAVRRAAQHLAQKHPKSAIVGETP